MFKSFDIVCRIRDFTTGPYGWSAALRDVAQVYVDTNPDTCQ
nr:hypothetical protein [Moritella sp. PE36]